MTYNKIIASFVLMLICLASGAQSITNSQAIEKARKFLDSGRPGKRMTPGSAVQLRQVSQQQILPDTRGTQLYMFNIGNDGGFVIVSGDERTPAILGYTDKGSINAYDIPENMRSWLQGYADEILALQNGAEVSEVSKVSARSAVSPFLGCEWGQEAPYNLQCPTIGGQHAPTGCTATALAQVLYYLRPENVTSIPSCVTVSQRITMPELPATTFNWDIMRPSYSCLDTDVSAQEAARLMLYVGQHLGVDYDVESSGASVSRIIARGAQDHFGIGNAASRLLREFVSSDEWDKIIYKEIANRRPVIVSGSKYNGAHSFVCDGCDGNGLYHINWGWDGYYNGYFYLNRLNPRTQASGGTNDGYTGNHSIVVGLEKNDGIVPVSIYGISDFVTSSTRASHDSNFNVTISATYINNSPTERNYQVCWGIFDENNDLVGLSSAEPLENAPQGFSKVLKNKTFVLGAGLHDGVYSLRALSHQNGVSEWKMCPDAYSYYLTMTVNGNTASLQRRESYLFGNRSYNISNVSIEGTHAANTEHVISFDVENTGEVNYSTMYLFVDRVRVNDIAVHLEPNATDRLASAFTISSPGTHTISITRKNSYGTDIVYETTYDIEAESFCPLTFNIAPEQYVRMEDGVYIVDSSEIMIDYEIINSGSRDYKSNVILVKSGENEKDLIDKYTRSVVVPAHGKVTMKQPLGGIIDGRIHNVYALYRMSDGYYEDPANRIQVRYDPFATAIKNVNSKSSRQDGHATLLDGRRASASYRGIVIKNGKKTLQTHPPYPLP